MLKKKSFQTFALLKGYAQKSQLGEVFTFAEFSTGTDGVLRTTSRGWYTFAHLALALIFSFLATSGTVVGHKLVYGIICLILTKMLKSLS